ncbi:hypothetical protein N657DRAFT_637315 [Parathielavia appendiculata]|uniref:Uncharacterized protein n=1 Tax=Parathielavia appendiculata TaxID=2587402 RepID=A0AAN6YZ14_9PEZI|nr:hypothetical protein N657DRAFT_637315 [Parathielavia appendiculata]
MKLPIYFSLFLPIWALVSPLNPMLCTSSPPLVLEAGVSIVSAAFSGKITEHCTSTLTFADSDFLPVTYEFDPDASCPGPLLASFIVPAAVPNGRVWVKWGDLSTPVLNKGTLDCVSDFAQVATTLATLTSTSRVTGTVSEASSVSTTSSLVPSVSDSVLPQPRVCHVCLNGCDGRLADDKCGPANEFNRYFNNNPDCKPTQLTI